MNNHRISLYGVVPVTRRQYLFQQTAAAALLAGLLVIRGVAADGIEALPPGARLTPTLAWAITLVELLPWLVCLVGVLVAVEGVIVLRMFARKAVTPPAAAPPARPNESPPAGATADRPAPPSPTPSA